MTNLAGGLGSQLGISASESAFGTFTSPTRFYEFNSETLKLNKKVTQGMGLRAGGAFARSQRRAVTTVDASGEIDLDIPTRGVGLLFGHALGSYPTAVGGVYTITPGDQGATSFTCQVGMARYDGTVVPKNLVGCKIEAMTLGITSGGLLNGKFSIDARNLETTTALASASYSAAYDVFHFAEGSIKINGSSVANIRDWSITLTNNLNTGRFNLGSNGMKSAQVHNALRTLTGSLTAEFTDNVLLNSLTADSSTSIDVTFTNGVEILQITTPVSFFNDGTPQVAGPSDIDISLQFESLDNGSTPVISIIYTTPDTSL